MNELLQFLKNHPEISLSWLEREIGMSNLHKVIKGERKLPGKHLGTLKCYLVNLQNEISKLDI